MRPACPGGDRETEEDDAEDVQAKQGLRHGKDKLKM